MLVASGRDAQQRPGQPAGEHLPARLSAGVFDGWGCAGEEEEHLLTVCIVRVAGLDDKQVLTWPRLGFADIGVEDEGPGAGWQRGLDGAVCPQVAVLCSFAREDVQIDIDLAAVEDLSLIHI